jgi:hypothetical protein
MLRRRNELPACSSTIEERVQFGHHFVMRRPSRLAKMTVESMDTYIFGLDEYMNDIFGLDEYINDIYLRGTNIHYFQPSTKMTILNIKSHCQFLAPSTSQYVG